MPGTQYMLLLSVEGGKEGKKEGRKERRKEGQRTKMAAWVDTLRLLAQPELTENRMARRSDTKEMKKKHTSRPVGRVEKGSQGREDSCGQGGTETGRVWDEWRRQSDH